MHRDTRPCNEPGGAGVLLQAVVDSTRKARMNRLGTVVALMTALVVVGAPRAASAPSGSGSPVVIAHGSARGFVGNHGDEVSANWAGYAATGATFTDVVGSWTEPTPTCSGKVQYAAFWVGIDGFSSGDTAELEQVGTDADCTKKGPNYYAWWQMLPAISRNFSRTSCPVGSGDAMTAEVSNAGGRFTLSITDTTRGWTCASPTETSSAPGLSAEWVVEDPSANATGRLLKLADFGTVNFTGAAADGSSLSALSTAKITMQVKRTVKAVTTPIFPDGGSFGVTWQHS
jgi:hypothetical protein